MGPQGAQGATGPQGPQGVAGATGPQGPAGAGLSGGQAGFVGVWTGASTMGTGSLFDNGNVGVGTTTPGAGFKLDVNGAVHAAGSVTSANPYLKVTFNNYPTSSGGYGVFLTGLTSVEQKGNIGFDTGGITINEGGLYLVGYTLGVHPTSAGCNHGWINIGGARYASWDWPYSSDYPIFSGSVPVILSAGAYVRIELFCGTLVNDGNPRNLWAVKLN